MASLVHLMNIRTDSSTYISRDCISETAHFVLTCWHHLSNPLMWYAFNLFVFENDSTPQLNGSRGIIVINDIFTKCLDWPLSGGKNKNRTRNAPMNLNNPPNNKRNSYVDRVSVDTDQQMPSVESQQVPAVEMRRLSSTPIFLEEPDTIDGSQPVGQVQGDEGNFVLSDRLLAETLPHTCGTTILLDLGFTLDEIGRFVKTVDTNWLTSGFDLTKIPDIHSGWTIQGMRKFLIWMDSPNIIVLKEGNQKKMLIFGFSNPSEAYIHFMDKNAIVLDHLHWRIGGYDPRDRYEPLDDVDLLLGGFGKGQTEKPNYGWSIDDVKEMARNEFHAHREKERKKWLKNLKYKVKKKKEDVVYKASSAKEILDAFGIMAQISSIVLSIRSYMKYRDPEILASTILQILNSIREIPTAYNFLKKVCEVQNEEDLGIANFIEILRRHELADIRGGDNHELRQALDQFPRQGLIFANQMIQAYRRGELTDEDLAQFQVADFGNEPGFRAASLKSFLSSAFGRVLNKIFTAAVISLIAKSIKSALDPTVAFTLIGNMARECDFIDMLITIGKKGVDFLATLFPHKFHVHLQRAKDTLDHTRLEEGMRKVVEVPPTVIIQKHFYDYADTGMPGLLADMVRYRELCERLGKPVIKGFEAAYSRNSVAHQVAEYRPMPFGVALIGPPGTGKTTLVNDIWEISKKAWGLETARSVAINPDAKFDDPYNGEEHVFLDDICSSKAELIQTNPFERILRIEQTHKNFSEQSEAPNKGAIPWNVRTLCVTSNVDKLGVMTYVNNSVAILRRFHCYVEVLPNPDNYTFNWTDVPPHYYETEFRYIFRTVVPEFNPDQPLQPTGQNRMEEVYSTTSRAEALKYIHLMLIKHIAMEEERKKLKEPLCLDCYRRPCVCEMLGQANDDVVLRPLGDVVDAVQVENSNEVIDDSGVNEEKDGDCERIQELENLLGGPIQEHPPAVEDRQPPADEEKVENAQVPEDFEVAPVPDVDPQYSLFNGQDILGREFVPSMRRPGSEYFSDFRRNIFSRRRDQDHVPPDLDGVRVPEQEERTVVPRNYYVRFGPGPEIGQPIWLWRGVDPDIAAFFIRQYNEGIRLNEIPYRVYLPGQHDERVDADQVVAQDAPRQNERPRRGFFWAHFAFLGLYYFRFHQVVMPFLVGVLGYPVQLCAAFSIAIHSWWVTRPAQRRNAFLQRLRVIPEHFRYKWREFRVWGAYQVTIWTRPLYYGVIREHMATITVVGALLVGLSVVGIGAALLPWRKKRKAQSLGEKWEKNDDPYPDIKGSSGVAPHGLKKSEKRMVVVEVMQRVAYGYFVDSTHVMTVAHLFSGLSPETKVYIRKVVDGEIKYETMTTVDRVQVFSDLDLAYVRLKETQIRFGSMFREGQVVAEEPRVGMPYYCYDPEDQTNYPLVFVQSRSNQTYKDDERTITIPKGYIFESRSKRFAVGDCGIVVVDSNGVNVGMLVGTAPNQDTILVAPFPKMDLEVVVIPKIEPVMPGSLSDNIVLAASGRPYGASVKIGELRGACGESTSSAAKESFLSKMELLINGEMLNRHLFGVPSVFRGGVVRRNVSDTHKRNLKILKQAKVEMDDSILERACNDYFKRVSKALSQTDISSVHPESYDNALMGKEHGIRIDELRPMKLHTAVGYPYATGKKRQYIQFYNESVLFDPKFKVYLDQCEDMLLRGETYFSVVKAQIKDEVVKISKTKTRLIYVGDTATYCICRKYFWWLPLMVYRHPIEFECAYGINPYSLEWKELQDYLNVHEFHMAADFSDWDLRLPKQLMDAAYGILCQLSRLGHGFPDDKFFSAFQPMFTSPVALFGRDLYNLEAGTPSGHPLTYILNSFANSIRARYCFYKLFPNLEYSDHVRGMYGGDDAHETTSLFAYNQLATLPIMIAMGIRPTDSSKNEVSQPFMERKDVTFLKRNEKGQIDVMTIHKMLSWTTSKNLLAHASGAVLSALFEIRMYGRESFDAFVVSLKDQMSRVVELNPANGADLRGVMKECNKFLDYDYEGYNFESTLANRRPEVFFDDKRVILNK